MTKTEIPADVRELVRETMNHYGNAQSNGANLIWNLYGVMRFAEACIVADRTAHPVNLTSERLNDVRAAIRTLPLAEAQPEFCVTDLVKRLPALEKKETYNALTYLASKGELERLGYGRYLIKGLLPPVTPKRTFEMDAAPYRSPVEDAAYYASVWGLSNAKMQELERAFTQHEVFGAAHAARPPCLSRDVPVETLHFIVGKFSDGEWHYLTGPADRETLERVLSGWQTNTPTARIVSAALSAIEASQ